MSEDAKPAAPQALAGAPRPQEAVEPSVGATTEHSENQAPPTGGSEPPVPARDYPKDARLLNFVNPPPPMPQDRTLLRFFRFLASLLFWGGSATGLAIVFYRAVVLPRLAVLSSRLTALYGHHLVHYTKFVDHTRKLALENEQLCPRTATLAAAVATPLPGDDTKDEAVQTVTEGTTANLLEGPPVEGSRPPSRLSEGGDKFVETKETNADQGASSPPPPDLLASLRISLATLRDEVQASTYSEEASAASPPKKLADSLELLSSYISTQSFHATQMKLNLGGGGFGQVPAPNGMQIQHSAAGEAAAQCRTEVRGLKGLLLNRRNFALLERWGDDDDIDNETMPHISS